MDPRIGRVEGLERGYTGYRWYKWYSRNTGTWEELDELGVAGCERSELETLVTELITDGRITSTRVQGSPSAIGFLGV